MEAGALRRVASTPFERVSGRDRASWQSTKSCQPVTASDEAEKLAYLRRSCACTGVHGLRPHGRRSSGDGAMVASGAVALHAGIA